ncbi:hypothetical protein [Clostridium sp.]|uniref:hypothetical protein n=1 Tax=Clostridium sp. TaxID=1506 RepID=UPI0028466788|nr:hypothetical protein [Clostridium sp.]MDR3595139.1 hypothetical protein [Clostridium sp.]
MKTKVIVRKLCRDILNLSMAISEEKETDVYVKYFPHVNELDVEIFPEGYSNNPQDIINHEIDLTGENAEQKLIKIKETLQSIWRCKDVSQV